MPSRMIKEGINESRGLAGCSIFAQDLYKRLITYADDYGRFNADLQIMLARLYPLELAVVTTDDLMEGLIELVGVGKIGFYTGYDKERVFGAFPKWGEHQRLRESKKKNPDPEDTEINDWYLQRYIPISMKEDVVNRASFKCEICGKHIAEIGDARKLIKLGSGLFHIDHVVPVGQGGRATLENLQLTCPTCNLSRKKRYTFEEILEFSRNSRKMTQQSDDCGTLQNFAETCGNLPQKSAGREEKGSEEKEKTNSAQARKTTSPTSFISDDDAISIQKDQNDVLDALKNAGFQMNATALSKYLDLFSEYGKDSMLAAIDQCVEHSVSKLDYLKKVLQNMGKPSNKKDDDGFKYPVYL